MTPGDANTTTRLWTEAAIESVLSAFWGIETKGLENVPLVEVAGAR